MKLTPLREWMVKAPWGNLALTSWGNAEAPPVLLVHGRQDCAVTFEPVLQVMPQQELYYVAIDMPGSSVSDPLPLVAEYQQAAPAPLTANIFVQIPTPDPQIPVSVYVQAEGNSLTANITVGPTPEQQNPAPPEIPDIFPEAPEPPLFLDFDPNVPGPSGVYFSPPGTPDVPNSHGVKIMRFHFLGAMEAALEHLGWNKFIFIGHSMGCELGLFYNTIHPGKITKMIFLDAEPTLRRLQVQDLTQYQPKFYDDYYNNYHKDNYYYRTYTKSQATQALMKARNLTEEKASILISKSLIHVAGDQYRFTWDRRLKLPAPQNYPNTYYFALFKNIPPTLLISALGSRKQKSDYKKGSLELIGMLCTLPNFKEVHVEGDHDVHLSYPERVTPYLIDFLQKNIGFQSKL